MKANTLLRFLGSILFITVFCLSCNYHFFYKEPTRKLSEVAAKPKLDKSKIALVGFYDFYTHYQRYGKIERYSINVSYYNRFIQYFDTIGTPIEDIKTGAKTNIPPKGLEFAKEFLNFTGPTGMQALENIFHYHQR